MEDLERLFIEAAEAQEQKPKPTIEEVVMEAARENQDKIDMYESIFGGKA